METSCWLRTLMLFESQIPRLCSETTLTHTHSDSWEEPTIQSHNLQVWRWAEVDQDYPIGQVTVNTSWMSATHHALTAVIWHEVCNVCSCMWCGADGGSCSLLLSVASSQLPLAHVTVIAIFKRLNASYETWLMYYTHKRRDSYTTHRRDMTHITHT